MNYPISSRLIWYAQIVLFCSLIFWIRLSGPSDLESYAQVLNIGYILDLMTQHNWLVQYDLEHDIMSKPPLHTWMMAPSTALLGLNRLALTLPSFISILVLALLIFEFGRHRFSEPAGGLAAMAIILAPTIAKQVALVRTDPAFTLAVAASALIAYVAWEQGRQWKRGWIAFWFMAALSTLIKGPLGIVLAAGGLLSFFWEKRSNPGLPTPRGPHLVGITLFLILTLGWFVAAWLSEGQALINKMLFRELVYHAVVEHSGGWQARDLLKPTSFLLLRYLPFSIPLLFALWRVFRHPADNPAERQFERFLACWLLFGLLIFSVVKHQRADHLLPLWPAGALLAGREMWRWAERISAARFVAISLIVSAVLIGITYSAVHSIGRAVDETNGYGRERKLARETELAAKAFQESGLDAGNLYHVNTPISLQLHLGTFRQFISPVQLEQLLAEATRPVDIALGETGTEVSKIMMRYPETKRLFRWPSDESLVPVFQVYRIDR